MKQFIKSDEINQHHLSPINWLGLVYEFALSLLILLWSYASLSKLVNFDLSLSQMKNQIFPIWLSEILSYVIPLTELAVAVLLIFKKTQKTAFLLSTFLLITFTIYIIMILLNFFGRIPCSCGGIISSLTWSQHFLFNSSFLGLSLFGIVYQIKQERRLLGNNS
jgi:hypothetical protein